MEKYHYTDDIIISQVPKYFFDVFESQQYDALVTTADD